MAATYHVCASRSDHRRHRRHRIAAQAAVCDYLTRCDLDAEPLTPDEFVVYAKLWADPNRTPATTKRLLTLAPAELWKATDPVWECPVAYRKEIEHEAYQLWLAAGMPEGRSAEFWYAAENAGADEPYVHSPICSHDLSFQ